jgi:hypothetical protein
MPFFETYSQRRRREGSQGAQDVYLYDDLPAPFRVQVIHIWNSAIGQFRSFDQYSLQEESLANVIWQWIHDSLAREHGVFQLVDGNMNSYRKCAEYLMDADTSGALDIIELSFGMIDGNIRNGGRDYRNSAEISQEADDAIDELNRRFQQHALGYQYVAGKIVRIDSQFLHAEAVMPALLLLSGANFRGPNDEFVRAFDHYRKGDYKVAVAEALKAFESTMKAICAARGWSHPSNATAIPLIEILVRNGLIPRELESHFGALRSAMESGLPTISNKTSRHGQGPEPTKIPSYFAAYALHLAAADIVFLVEAHKTMK